MKHYQTNGVKYGENAKMRNHGLTRPMDGRRYAIPLQGYFLIAGIIAVLIGCAGSVPLTKENRVSIRSVSIKREVQNPGDMVRGSNLLLTYLFRFISISNHV